MLNAGLVLRALAKSDIDLLFQWRNLDQIISLSSTRRAVTWPEHSAWFSGIHNNNRIISYIIEFEELPVGHLRFELEGGSLAVITIYLIPGFYGRGIGSSSILLACNKLKQCHEEIHSVQAKIRSDNLRSIRSFNKAGFVMVHTPSMKNNFSSMKLDLNSGTQHSK